MQSRIKIIKRSAVGSTNDVSATEKTLQQREREMANSVKSWVAEWEARNRALKATATSLIRSLENSTPSPVTQSV